MYILLVKQVKHQPDAFAIYARDSELTYAVLSSMTTHSMHVLVSQLSLQPQAIVILYFNNLLYCG
jgi:hypothetical protein